MATRPPPHALPLDLAEIVSAQVVFPRIYALNGVKIAEHPPAPVLLS